MRKSWITTTAGAAGLAAALALGGHAAAAETVLRVGMGANDVGSLDPHISSGTPEKALFGWMFNGLVRIEPGRADPSHIEPDLATSWETSDDGLTWTFTLREGVQCHGDYGELTAEDVVYSLERAADRERSNFAGDYAAFEAITAVDPYTVEIQLSEPIPTVLGLLVNYQGGNIVCKAAAEAAGDDFGRTPVGTGPFMFESYTPQDSVVLVANPDYYRGKPKIDRIEYRIIPSVASRDLAFRNGELDITFGAADKRWYERMSEVEGARVVAFRPGELYTLHLNQSTAPLDDPKVRQAIAHAIPRSAIAKYRGEAVVNLAASVVPIGYLGHSDEVGLYPYDPDKAKALLAEAGYPDGITLEVLQTSLPVMRQTMEVVQGQLQKAGITLDLQIVDHATWHSMIRQDLSQMVMYAAARFPVADVYLNQFYDSRSIVGTQKAVTNFSHCSVADAQIRAASSEVDPERRNALWAEAQRKVVQDVCGIPIYEALQVWAISDRVELGYELEGSLSLGPVITPESDITQ